MRHNARPFITSTYRLSPGDAPKVILPTRCPWFREGDEECRVVLDFHRERKTGPEFAIAVARCPTHEHAFTIYPPGHVPYGRKRVAPVDQDGHVLRRGKGEPGAGEPAWEQTIFIAATDAAEGRAWARSSPSDDDWRRRTQGRWLVLGATLLGLSDVTQRVREQLSEHLGVAFLDLEEASRAYRQAFGWRDRGQAIARLLELLPIRRSLCDDLLVCGAIAGLWGRPSRWDPGGPLGGVMVSAF